MTEGKQDALKGTQNNKVSEKIQRGRDLLQKYRPLTLENIKESCKKELQRFIDSRGSIDKKTGDIHLPLLAASQNAALIIEKIKVAHDLISKIERSDSLDKANLALQIEFQSDLCSSTLGSDLAASVGKCMFIIGSLKEISASKSPAV